MSVSKYYGVIIIIIIKTPNNLKRPLARFQMNINQKVNEKLLDYAKIVGVDYNKKSMVCKNNNNNNNRGLFVLRMKIRANSYAFSLLLLPCIETNEFLMCENV